MKNVIFMIGAVLSLTLVSFSETQKGTVVKLRDGNYQVKNLETNLKDLISQLGEFKGWKESTVLANKVNEIDLNGKVIDLSRLKGVKGWKETAVVHKSTKTAAIHDNIHKDLVSKTIWRDKEFKMEGVSNAQNHIDKVMNEFN
ncbi:hypothetical protein [Aureibaculum luteum]|uniref:hypothetical protein n=1 Tax=Aureibaculum luteum TaxID=1548456 RepID=UPI000E5530BE|nr:hypothetical protein [Aureibaculum luteum]